MLALFAGNIQSSRRRGVRPMIIQAQGMIIAGITVSSRDAIRIIDTGGVELLQQSILAAIVLPYYT